MQNKEIKRQTAEVCTAIRLINQAISDFILCDYDLNLMYCPSSNNLTHPPEYFIIKNDLIFNILVAHQPHGKINCLQVVLNVLSEMLSNLLHGVAVETAEFPRSSRLKKLIDDAYCNIKDAQLRDRIIKELEAALKEQEDKEALEGHKVWIPVEDPRAKDLKMSAEKYKWPNLEHDQFLKDIEIINKPSKCSKSAGFEVCNPHGMKKELNEAIEIAEDLLYFNRTITIDDKPIKNHQLDLALKSVINESPHFTALVIGELEEKLEQLEQLTEDND
jgi:hypothetical protein